MEFNQFKYSKKHDTYRTLVNVYNFKREDFKANCPGLGGVAAFQLLWLNEITNPESEYLIEDPDNKGEKINLSGVKFSIWNNSSFTTVFSW